MISLDIDFTVFKVDQKRFKKTLDKNVKTQMRQAVREFLRAAVPRIPVDTGMARGAFLHLGRLLNVAVPITPRSKNKLYYHDPAYGKPKTQRLGENLTYINGKPSLGIRFDTIITRKGNTYLFSIESDIFHLILNDVFGSQTTGPWKGFQHGRAAFVKYLEDNKTKVFGELSNYLLKSNIGVTETKYYQTSYAPLTSTKKNA
jgi:hypothetical protein